MAKKNCDEFPRYGIILYHNMFIRQEYFFLSGDVPQGCAKDRYRMLRIIKRSGQEVDFDGNKIILAVTKANDSVDEVYRLTVAKIQAIEQIVEDTCAKSSHFMQVEEIQDLVIQTIMQMHGYEVAQNYIIYRYKQELLRKRNTTDDKILSLLSRKNEELIQENSNKNPIINSVQRDYMAGEVSKDISKRYLLPEQIVEAHEKGILHFHDADYFVQPMHNCCLVNLEDMLMNGTVISETQIDRPNRFTTACNISMQIVAQVASAQYGGQTLTLSHLVPFVDISRQNLRQSVREEFTEQGISYTEEMVAAIAEKRLKKDIKNGVQLIQYQLITLMTTNGQAPFVTIFMYLSEVPPYQRDDLVLIIDEMLRQRIQGVKNEKGVYITPAFPKLIYVLEEDNIHETSKYWSTTVLAAKCTAKRMVPDYISEKVMKQLKQGNCFPMMGCRSALTPDRTKENLSRCKNYTPGKKFYGRFNQGVVTLNLVDVACSSGKDMDAFWHIMEERLELCHKALRIRHEHLLGTPSDVAPILWQHGALARLKKGETIDSLLYDGYSTLSLGYAGLYECTRFMTGESHTGKGKDFAISVMQKLNDACEKWKKEENIDYSVYGTPLESTTYKFAKTLQQRFGKISGVTDKNYITNSYHVHVTEKINAFDKLSFEADFQKLSPGGAISYVEVPNMQNNVDAVLAIMRHIYDHIMYAELNTKSDYCQICGYDGEIQIIADNSGKLIWECPNCGNQDQSTMNVARRTCGYIGSQYWNQGRTQEIKERVLHI